MKKKNVTVAMKNIQWESLPADLIKQKSEEANSDTQFAIIQTE